MVAVEEEVVGLLNKDGLGVVDVLPKRFPPGAGGWLLLDPNKFADDVLIDRPPGPLADLDRAMIPRAWNVRIFFYNLAHMPNKGNLWM